MVDGFARLDRLSPASLARALIVEGLTGALQRRQDRFGFLEQLSDLVEQARIFLARRRRLRRGLDLLRRRLNGRSLLRRRLHAERGRRRGLRVCHFGGDREHRQRHAGHRDMRSDAPERKLDSISHAGA
jgi:hypothetical protein